MERITMTQRKKTCSSTMQVIAVIGVIKFVFILCLLGSIFTDSKNDTDENAEIVTEFWQDIPEEQSVLKLSPSDLKSLNRNHSDIYVMFYANWCPYSQEARFEFAYAAKMIENTDGFEHIRFGAIDCDQNLSIKETCKGAFNITSVPLYQYYQGEQDEANEIVNRPCPKYTDNKYFNYIVFKGNGKYCLGAPPLPIETDNLIEEQQKDLS